MLFYGLYAMLLMKAKHCSAHVFATYSNIFHLLTVITVHSLSVIYHANVSIKNTARNTYDMSLPFASVHCQTPPKTGATMLKHSISP